MNNKQELELLAPAGNLEKMKTALQFGADAVYFGLPDFSLRARSNNFTKKDIIKAQEICQTQGKKFYITMNIYAHNIHLNKIEKQLEWLKSEKIKPDGMIISDPGIIRLVQKYLSGIEIHLSTQANATNIEAVKFWRDRGIKRVVLAREVTVDEIREIHEAVPEVELEVFIHGAMCMSYSGRCILSKWMTDRSANLGDCAQPCRWKWNETDFNNLGQNEAIDYKLKQEGDKNNDCGNCGIQTDLVDDKNRFGMRVEEDQHGTYMFNSYDISLIAYVDKLIEAGVTSFKIEGRAKSIYYVAVITRAYRLVLETLSKGVEKSELRDIIEIQEAELNKMSNRGYWTGFVLGDEPPHLFDKAYLSVEWEFVGISGNKNNKNKKGKKHYVFVHNKLAVGDEVEIIMTEKNINSKIKSIKNEEGKFVDSAHGGLGQLFRVEFAESIPKYFLLRKKLERI